MSQSFHVTAYYRDNGDIIDVHKDGIEAENKAQAAHKMMEIMEEQHLPEGTSLFGDIEVSTGNEAPDLFPPIRP